MAAAVTADESTSVGMGAFCLLFPGGPGACAYAVLPTDAGYGSGLYTADNLSMANLTGGAAAAAGRWCSRDSARAEVTPGAQQQRLINARPCEGAGSGGLSAAVGADHG